MDLALNDEQRIIIDMVRRFVREEIIPLEETLDPDADEVAPEKLKELVDKTKELSLIHI